jgi:hypothetical protein
MDVESPTEYPEARVGVFALLTDGLRTRLVPADHRDPQRPLPERA